ncbi:MAG: tRNA epoxyqueuosine(34) reductase QueG [Candidatus Eremiobacteraeota bacterium]|nr:tRNA epoxyqueuosine(34) reductase QueG [Candidatus Eremiobacteraeota bacterium]MBC5801898.1 tRNA epoxyqueuosine(34) reductase QueG [Candidatus Eremiobacteraeota bacterium]MBC5821731.1 tRNA epoxyqueuosine(34) reductase QueG [Candidatus Eremiobacteraeota bacterium]
MTSEPEELAARVRTVAREAGASAVAIAAARRDGVTETRLREAFARGDFATWHYDDAYAARATSPQSILPGARSVICVAVAYATRARSRALPLQGRVSNYAWSHDYHRRVRGILEPVAAALDAFAGEPATRIVCDTTPFAERAFAARAGLGWIGKHTNLIAPKIGSFVFLGEIVTTLLLTPDAPLTKSCGSCRRCVDVCPTGALRGDATIDARRCISDLTQRTDAVPISLRPLMGTWVWGCDLCQEACPPTQRAGFAADAAFAPQDDARAQPDLPALLRLRSSRFKREFRATAMGWRGAAVLRRNAAVALGNTLDRAAVPVLAQALEDDPHPLVRGHAAWALGRIGSPAAVAALRERHAREGDAQVRDEIAAALGAMETFTGAQALELGRASSAV